MVQKVLGGVARPSKCQTSSTIVNKEGSASSSEQNNNPSKSSPPLECDNTLVSKIVGKARDYLRSLHAKLNNTAGILPPNFSLCEGMICVELAFKFLNINQKFDREIAVQQIGANIKDYQSCFSEVVNMLGISFPILLDDLILTFGCQGIRGSCEKLLEEYRKKFESRYPAEILKKTDFNKPILKVAAFYITATQTYKFKVDFKKLADETKTNTKSLGSVVDSMKETCGIVSNTVKVKQNEDQKRKRVDLDNSSTVHSVHSHHVTSSDGLMGFDESKVVLKKKKLENNDSPKPLPSKTTSSIRSNQLLQKLYANQETKITVEEISSTAASANNEGKQKEEAGAPLKKTKQTKLNFFK